jgi:VTT domain
MLGALSSAALTYWLGRALGRDAVSRLAGRWVDRVLRDLSYRGLLAVATVRVMPLAPFSVINAVAGAIGIRFRDFMLGTLLGMTPGALALVLFVDRVQSAAGQPDVARWATAAGVLLVIALSALGARRWLRRGGALLIGVSLAVSALGAPADPVLARARSIFADKAHLAELATRRARAPAGFNRPLHPSRVAGRRGGRPVRIEALGRADVLDVGLSGFEVRALHPDRGERAA